MAALASVVTIPRTGRYGKQTSYPDTPAPNFGARAEIVTGAFGMDMKRMARILTAAQSDEMDRMLETLIYLMSQGHVWSAGLIAECMARLARRQMGERN